MTSVDRLADGLARLSAAGVGHDAILLDLSLPDSQGVETYLAVRRQAPTVPVIILYPFTANESVSSVASSAATAPPRLGCFLV